MLNNFGVKLDTLGDSTGVIENLFNGGNRIWFDLFPRFKSGFGHFRKKLMELDDLAKHFYLSVKLTTTTKIFLFRT